MTGVFASSGGRGPVWGPIDEQTDACLRVVRGLVSAGCRSADRERAVTVLELQLRRLSVLRARTLALYTAGAKSGGDA